VFRARWIVARGRRGLSGNVHDGGLFRDFMPLVIMPLRSKSFFGGERRIRGC